ncbi:putative reverse transcriptase, RNA-dependent DNA polymerase [Tanacetum coccineum]|uniref:Reverse transcriptase, RNA-dependent DNA polymerase n=1 Tax=Tanacetum coccineum TaxID=301880 RepID=A0ABQ5BPP5_9ASTR
MDNTSAPIIEDWNSDDESEIDYTIEPSIEKIKYVKTVRETDAPKQNPRWNQRNWNNIMSQRLGIVARNKTNGIAGTKDNTVAGQAQKEKEPEQEYILIPICTTDPSISQGPKDRERDTVIMPTEVDENEATDTSGKDDVATRNQQLILLVSSPPVNTARPSIDTANAFEEHLFERFSPFKNAFSLPPVPNISSMDNTGIFGNAYDDEDVEEEVDINNIEEEVYVCQPPGFEDPHFPNKVYKVEKVLYGLHQAPRAYQDKYVAEILKKFDFASIKTTSTPMETNKQLTKDEEAENVDVLKRETKLGLWYPRDSPFDLEAFSDSDYAGASLDRKSTTGGCQFLGKRLISWQCKKQTIVANSTTEAEYVATANCCGQVLWIQNQMLDYGYNLMNTNIYIDNESTICIVKNPVSHSKTKHIEIRYHFIRDSYEKKLIQVIKIHTDKNVADLLTKAFDVSRFNFLIASIGLLNL